MLRTEGGLERRVYERLLLRCPVRFRPDREAVLAEASSKDISDGGLGLFTRSKLAPDMCLEMQIKLSPRIKPLHIRGTVVWSHRGRPGLWRAGICFDEMAFIKVVKILISKSLN